MFLRLISAERTRAIVPVGELFELSRDPGEVHRVLDRLIRSRLLVSQTTNDSGGGSTGAGGTVEIVHESLIHSWPLLRRWLEETQEDAAYLEQLRNAAKQWQAKGFAQGLLWRGEAMEEAKLWHSRYRGDLPDLQRAYLTAVFSLSDKATRRKRLAVSAAIGFLSLLLVAAGVGLVMIRNAQQEATAQARRVEEQLNRTRVAEQGAKAAHAKELAAKQKLESQNTSLVAAINAAERARTEAETARTEAESARVEAEQSQGRAEKSKRRERKARRRATEKARQAELAEAKAERANENLATLLAEEKKRVQELEDQTRGVKIIPDVTLK
jgi:hypothetical protein